MSSLSDVVRVPEHDAAVAAPHDAAGWLRTAKDVAAGTAGGIAQVLAGQPFDTIKVRLQAQSPSDAKPRYTGTLDCARQTWTLEGPRAFYKGTVMPLLGVGACVSIQFAVLEACKRRMHTPGTPFTASQLFVAGAAAGVANSVVSAPVEHLRILLQTQQPDPQGRLPYAGPLDAIRTISRRHGVAALFRGQTVTALREFGGFGMYFMTYELLTQRAMAAAQCRRDQLATSQVLLHGALGGFAMWLSIFPLDVIKSKVQTDAWGPARRYTSALDAARQTLRAQGPRGFFRGLAPCMLRAAPANAATFIAFEWAMRTLDRVV